MAEQISLVRQAFALWRRHIWRLVAVVAVVAVPTGVISNLMGSDKTTDAYISVATLLMNLALIWTVVRLQADKKVTLRSAYYDGTAGVVRFLLVAVVLAAQFIPAAIGYMIYLLGTTGPTVAASTGERLLLGVAGALFAIPTIRWVVRYIFSLYIVVESGSRPIAALRASRSVVRGHFLRVLRSLVALAIILIAALMVPSYFVAVVGTGLLGVWLAFAVQLFVSLFALPYINIYLYLLYLDLAREPR